MAENIPPDDDDGIPGIDRPSTDEGVGYGRPPKQHQFKRGQSGNPKGRPKKQIPDQISVVSFLDEPMKVTIKGRPEKLQAFEIGARRMVQKAVQERDARAAIELLKLCASLKVFKTPVQQSFPSVVIIPTRWDGDAWMTNFRKYGPPPWPGPDDGLTDEARTRAKQVEPIKAEDPRISALPRAKLPRRNLLLHLLMETHSVKENGVAQKYTTLELVIRVLKAQAIAPDLRAMRFLDKMLKDYGPPPPPARHPVIISYEQLSEEDWILQYGTDETKRQLMELKKKE